MQETAADGREPTYERHVGPHCEAHLLLQGRLALRLCKGHGIAVQCIRKREGGRQENKER